MTKEEITFWLNRDRSTLNLPHDYILQHNSTDSDKYWTQTVQLQHHALWAGNNSDIFMRYSSIIFTLISRSRMSSVEGQCVNLFAMGSTPMLSIRWIQHGHNITGGGGHEVMWPSPWSKDTAMRSLDLQCSDGLGPHAYWWVGIRSDTPTVCNRLIVSIRSYRREDTL